MSNALAIPEFLDRRPKSETDSEYPWPIHPATSLFPMLGKEELSELANDIKANGLLEPLWLYEDAERGTVLLDGRNRFLACKESGVEPETRFYTGLDPIGFVISENLHRRHLTTGQKAAIAHAAEPLFAEEAARRKAQATGKPRGQKANPSLPADRQEESRRERESTERAAKATGTSGRSVARYKRIAKDAPDLAEKVNAGGMSLDRAERILRDREAEKKRIEQAKSDAEKTGIETKIDIRHGDFRELLADLKNIDAVITDPPYPKEFLPLLSDLASWADKTLKPEGVLVVLLGQTHLEDAYRLLSGHRPYRWTGCYLTSGPGYVSHARRVQSNWKPLLIYGGGPRVSDVIRADGDSDAKTKHKWGQDFSAFQTIIERFTKRGETIVDPFMGGGTTLIAANALGRHAIGCDVDEKAVETTKSRLA